MRRELLIGFMLAALTLGVYWPVRTHDFIVYDDPEFITENPQLQSGLSWSTVVYAFTQPVVGNWHPITTLSHALDRELFGVNAGAQHLVNAFFHAANVLLLFLVLQLLSRENKDEQWPDGDSPRATGFPDRFGWLDQTWRSALIAAIFAFHPLRVESVAWLAERKDVLSGFFFLLTLWSYAQYAKREQRAEGVRPKLHADAPSITSGSRRSPGPIRRGFFSTVFGRRRAWGYYLAALTCFALGLMSKPMVVTLPFVLVLLDYWPLKRFQFSNLKLQISKLRPLLLEKKPFLLLTVIECWITLNVQKRAGAMHVIEGSNWSERLGNAVTSYVRYLGKMIWPTDLSIIYPHPGKHYFLADQWPGWEIGLAGLLLVLITVLVLWSVRRRLYLAVGWLWFLGTLVPVIGLVQVGEQAMADRYTYIPLIGPVIAVVWWVGEAVGSGAFAQTLGRLGGRFRSGGVALVPGLTSGAGQQDAILRYGRLKTCATGCGIAVAFAYCAALIFLTRHQLGYWQNTMTLFEHAVAVTTDNPSAQFALGVGLEREGEASKAMVRYRVAIAIDPHYAKAYYNMGQLLRKSGRWPEAAQAYLAADRLNPTDVATKLNLASVLPHLGRAGEAVARFQEALRLDANSVEGLNNLAWLLSTTADPSVRDGAQAVRLAERACSLTGSKVPVLLGTLAAAYAEAGRYADAVATAEKACAEADAAGDPATAARNRQLLEIYREGKPYREKEESRKTEN